MPVGLNICRLETGNNIAVLVVYDFGMSIEKFIDQQVQAAIARGEFDGLEGEGRPLNLDAYFATPEDVRLGYSMLKSNDFVPEEVDRLKEIAELKEKLTQTTDEVDREKITKLLSQKFLALSLLLERNKRKR